MDEDDELLRGRVYGTDHDDPGPRPGHVYRELVAGPLDGLLLDVTGWTDEQLADGAALLTEIGSYGAAAAPTTAPVRTTDCGGTGRATRPNRLPAARARPSTAGFCGIHVRVTWCFVRD